MNIQSIGEMFNIAPSFIYNLFRKSDTGLTSTKNNGNISRADAGRRYGRMLISELFNENNLSWEEGTAIYRNKGIHIRGDDNIRNIAEKNNILPGNLVKMLE